MTDMKNNQLYYMCDLCNNTFKTFEEAINCENWHKEIDDRYWEIKKTQINRQILKFAGNAYNQKKLATWK